MVLIGSCMKSVCRVSGDVDCAVAPIFFLRHRLKQTTNKWKVIGGSLWQWWYRHMCLCSGTHTKKHNLQQTTNKEQNSGLKKGTVFALGAGWKEMSVLFVLFFNAVFALTERSICRETSLTLGTPQSTALTVHGWMTKKNKQMFCLPHFPTFSSLKAMQLLKITISKKCIRWKLNGLLQLSLIWNQYREADLKSE